MKVSGVYGGYNYITDKWYIGSSNDVWSRCKTHQRELDKGTHNGPKLLRAWQKYGPDVWFWLVLERFVGTRKELISQEQLWIDHFDSYRNGYNSLPRAGVPCEGKWSEERRQRTLANHQTASKRSAEVQRRRWDSATKEERIQHGNAISQARLSFSAPKKETLAEDARAKWNGKPLEERQIHADKVKIRFAAMTPKERREYVRLGKNEETRRKQYQLKQCPYCLQWFKPMTFGRYHGERCKARNND